MNKLYDDWLNAKANLAKFKKEELNLRNEIIDSLIEDQISGSIKFSIDEYNITIGLGLNNSIDEPVLDTIYKDMTDEEKACIKYKPGLVAKELKKLTGNEAIFEAIITKPKQATLVIK